MNGWTAGGRFRLSKGAVVNRDAAQLDQCYWHRCEDGDLVLIPRCMGCAVAGPDGCTCDIPGSQLEQALVARRAAETEVERLRDKAVARQDYAQSLWNENKRLRAQLREMSGKT